MIEKFIENVKNEWDKLLPELLKSAKKELEENVFEIDFNYGVIPKLPEKLGFGVYLFKIIPSKEFDSGEFLKNWKSKYVPIKTPNISKSRFDAKDDSRDVFDFYIGKSEKLDYRIKEHCFQDKNKTTYGLKLAHRNKLLKSAKFLVSYFEVKEPKINKEDKDILQFIITNLEKELRREFNPWVGKQ